MKCVMMFAAAVALIGNVGGAPAVRVQQHVPERLDTVRLIDPAAAKKNHILIVNVDNAIPKDMWANVVTYATSRLQLNVWTNAVADVDLPGFVFEPGRVQKTYGEKAKVGLFVVNKPKLTQFVGAPGYWYATNVRGLDADNPDAQTLRDRYAKMLLKGLAYACGGGASLDSACSLFYGSFTTSGMDKTGIMISPTTYFPMLEILRDIGGNEILTPAMDE